MASPLKAPPVAAPFVLPFALTPPGCTAAHIGQNGTMQEDMGQLKHDGLGFSPSCVELLSIVSLLERLAACHPPCPMSASRTALKLLFHFNSQLFFVRDIADPLELHR